MKPIKVMFNNDDIDRVSIDDDQSADSMDKTPAEQCERWVPNLGRFIFI